MAEERKNECALKLPIGNEEDDMMDFLEIDEEELVHDVKQAVSPSSSRSLENPDFNGINLLLSSTNTISGGGAMVTNQSGQFVPYLGHPLLFPGNNQNLFNLVALCITTPPPFNGLPQNNPFFLSNGINEHMNVVPFSPSAPFFYFGLPEETLTGAGGNYQSAKYGLGKNTVNGFGNSGFNAGGFPGNTLGELESENGGNLMEGEIQYNSAKLRPNLIQTGNTNLPNGLNEFNPGFSKVNKLDSNQFGLVNNSNFDSGDVAHTNMGRMENRTSGGYCNYDLHLEKREYSELTGNMHRMSNRGHGISNYRRQNVNKLNANGNIGVASSGATGNSVSLNSGNGTGEKKNRWQLSDPQFKSGYKGVSWNSRMEAWLAFFVENGVRKSKTFSSRKFGFNRAREKAIKYLDARRKGIILTTPPPLSPSKGIYDRIPQQRKLEPEKEGSFVAGSQEFRGFSGPDNNESNLNIPSINSHNNIYCNQTIESNQRIIYPQFSSKAL
ncbi:AP2 domain-containing protein [Cryptosporidium felis]|nr:AP2 domain-containing protein [Cryptosporidium felis]